MRLTVAGFALGVLALQLQPVLPDSLAIAAVGLIAACGAAAMTRMRRWRTRSPGAVSACVCAVAAMLAGGSAGFAYAAYRAQWRLAERLDPRLEGVELSVTGVVAGLPQWFDRGGRFEFEIETVAPPEAAVPQRVQLTWYNGLSREESLGIAPLRAGERWRFTVRLSRPHGNANPHGFDYEGWLFERGVRATGTVVARDEPERLDSLVMRPDLLVGRWREILRERFRDALGAAPYAGVLIALAIGDQRAIEPSDWTVFTATGVNHLMSISGLHVTMVSGLVGMLLMFGWRRVEALALRVPAQKAGAAAGLLAAAAYCVLAGFAVPAQRTLYMVGIAALALLFGRGGAPSRVLALALALVLIVDPWAVLSPGFWLSFGAVAVIFFVGSRVPGRRAATGWLRGALVQWGVMQWAVTLGLAPALVVMFQQVSLSSPVANAVAIPLVSLVITPLVLIGAVVPLDAPLLIAHALFEPLVWLLRALARVDELVWRQHAPPGWTLLLALAGVAWTLMPRGFPARALGLALLVPMTAVSPQLPAPGAVQVTIIDVGQGLAVLVRTRNYALLYDAGPLLGPEADSGSRVVVPMLRALGVRSLDALVVSHDDSDHSGGARSVLRALPVGALWSSLDSNSPIAQAAALRLPCTRGRGWAWDGVRFEFLHPGDGQFADVGEKANNLSCVLRVATPGGAVLIAGDAEARAEAAMLDQARGVLKSRVLVVPHHGARTSSTPEFVAASSPEFAVFAAGHRNRFGHPHPEIVARYRNAGARILRTDSGGAIEITLDRTGEIAAVEHRSRARRYWFGG